MIFYTVCINIYTLLSFFIHTVIKLIYITHACCMSLISFQTHTTQATALHIASRNNCLDIASLLLKAGAKLDLKDADGKVWSDSKGTVTCTVCLE